MPSYMLRDLPQELWGQVKTRASDDGRGLRETVLILLARGLTAGAGQRQGGHARAASLTTEERRTMAQHAAQTRWRRRG